MVDLEEFTDYPKNLLLKKNARFVIIFMVSYSVSTLQRPLIFSNPTVFQLVVKLNCKHVISLEEYVVGKDFNVKLCIIHLPYSAIY